MLMVIDVGSNVVFVRTSKVSATMDRHAGSYELMQAAMAVIPRRSPRHERSSSRVRQAQKKASAARDAVSVHNGWLIKGPHTHSKTWSPCRRLQTTIWTRATAKVWGCGMRSLYLLSGRVHSASNTGLWVPFRINRAANGCGL